MGPKRDDFERTWKVSNRGISAFPRHSADYFYTHKKARWYSNQRGVQRKHNLPQIKWASHVIFYHVIDISYTRIEVEKWPSEHRTWPRSINSLEPTVVFSTKIRPSVCLYRSLWVKGGTIVTTGGQCCRLQSDVNAYTTSATSSSTKFPYQPTTTLLVVLCRS